MVLGRAAMGIEEANQKAMARQVGGSGLGWVGGRTTTVPVFAVRGGKERKGDDGTFAPLRHVYSPHYNRKASGGH